MENSILITILVSICSAAILVLVTWLRKKKSILAMDNSLYDKKEPNVGYVSAKELENDGYIGDSGLKEGIISKDDTYYPDAEGAPASDSIINQIKSELPDIAASETPDYAAEPQQADTPASGYRPATGAKPRSLYIDAEADNNVSEQLEKKIARQLLVDSEQELYSERDLFSLLVYNGGSDKYLSGSHINEMLDFIRARRPQYELTSGALNVHHMRQRKDGNTNLINYSLRNAIEPWSLDQATLADEKFRTPGLVFFLSVSISSQPVEDFELMLQDASAIADHYELVLADDEYGNPISIQQISATRQLLAEKQWQKQVATRESRRAKAAMHANERYNDQL